MTFAVIYFCVVIIFVCPSVNDTCSIGILR
nr:MAG TPA: hypothetical protein [Inoviridae sp.]